MTGARKARLSTILPVDLITRLDEVARSRVVGRNVLVERLLEAGLDRLDAEAKERHVHYDETPDGWEITFDPAEGCNRVPSFVDCRPDGYDDTVTAPPSWQAQVDAFLAALPENIVLAGMGSPTVRVDGNSLVIETTGYQLPDVDPAPPDDPPYCPTETAHAGHEWTHDGRTFYCPGALGWV